jgi:hypothetical protein
MSQCPDCGCDLPSFQTLCSKCYDAKYAGVGRPKSILRSIWQFGSNAQRRQVIEDRINAQPWWLAWCFAVIGLGFDWRCAFEWFAGKSPFYSELVLGRTLLIVLACAGVAVLIVWVTRESRWRIASTLFLVFSASLYRLLSNHWTAYRR